MDGGDSGPGSLALAGLIDQHGEDLAHDLLHHYRIDLRDALRDLLSDDPKGSPWWLLTLIRELPDEGHLKAALRGGPEFRGWGLDRYLSAATFDAVQANTVVTARAAGAKKVKDAQPWSRPDVKRKQQTTRTLADLVAQQRR